MTDRQLIIIQSIVREVKDKSRFNSDRDHFEQARPLEIPMYLSEYRELDNIITEIDDLLADIPNLVAETH